jgi:hypothetical protein
MTPAPPSPFPDVNRVTLPAETPLHRVHSSERLGNSFNPCLGQPSRFAPLRRQDGSCIPTAYAASTFECAVHETIFHAVDHDAPRKSIPFGDIALLAYTIIRPRRDLILAGLFEPDLNRWGLTRQNLIDTHASDYGAVARWALAIHDRHMDIDGLVWTSRRCDPFQAYVFYGDRLASGDLDVIASEKFKESNARLLEIRAFAARADVLIAF